MTSQETESHKEHEQTSSEKDEILEDLCSTLLKVYHIFLDK